MICGSKVTWGIPPRPRPWRTPCPSKAAAQLWGEEIYFPVPQVVADLDDSAAVVVNVGDLGYWPTGRAFCLFFGLTPGSIPGEIRPASAVNLVGRLRMTPAASRWCRRAPRCGSKKNKVK